MTKKQLKINIDEIPKKKKTFTDFLKKNKVLNLRLSKI